ncbi:MAG: Fur family transcriptional regulator [Kineosporiaceae bacterium]
MGDRFDALLRAHGVRATPQRRLVLQAVTDLGHGTPEQVCERVQASEAAVSLSTVYRTLELLEQLDLVAHTHLRHGAPTYHPAEHADHVHLVCRRCGHVDQLPVDAAAELARTIQATNGFEPDIAHLSVHGVCSDCKAVSGPDGKLRGGARG